MRKSGADLRIRGMILEGLPSGFVQKRDPSSAWPVALGHGNLAGEGFNHE